MSGSSQSLDYFFTIGCTSTNYTLGQSHQNALRQMYVNNLWDYVRYEMFEWGSIWGNPDLTMGPVTTSPPPSVPVVSGPSQVAVNTQCMFSATSTDPSGDQVYYRFIWGDGNSSDWVGPYPSGTTGSASHAWSIPGQYIVKARAKNVEGATGDSSEPFIVTVVIDSPPGTPTITGPSTGKPHQTNTYGIQAIDPECDNISYYIDWGDGKNSGWFGTFPSGQTVNLTHTWAKQGSYVIRVGSQDCFGMRSQWGTLHISMPYQPPYWNFLQRLFDRFPHAFPFLRLILERQ